MTFQEDLSRLRKSHGGQNMALVRKFAFNSLRAATQLSDPPNLPVKPWRRPTKPPRPKSLKLRRKIASWDVNRLAQILTIYRVNPINPDSEPWKASARACNALTPRAYLKLFACAGDVAERLKAAVC